MRYILIIILTSFIMINCSTNDKNVGEIKIMDESLKQDLQTVAKAKIFFGHQSVGYNIMDGLQQLNLEAGNILKIIEIDKNTSLHDSYIGHGKNGQNEQPKTKCDAFKDVFQAGFADSLDLALFKFCYIDINTGTDILDLFEYYKRSIQDIQESNPTVKIIHVSVPLRLVQSGWKASIKKLLGKELGGVADNMKRNQFNDLLHKEYQDQPIYDLAKVESTYPDGSRASFEKDGNIYYAMAPEYTYDGGHLNALGSQLAAKELVHTLAKAHKKD